MWELKILINFKNFSFLNSFQKKDMTLKNNFKKIVSKYIFSESLFEVQNLIFIKNLNFL